MGLINFKQLVPLFLIVVLAGCLDEAIDSISEDEGLVEGNGEVQTSHEDSLITSANENVFVLEDTSIVLNDLLTNDVDELGGVLTILSFSQSVKGGGVELASANVLKYTPALNYFGLDSFTYVITNSQGVTATAQVNINVEPVNDVPNVSGESVELPENTSLLLIGLLANDTDKDADELKIAGFTQSEQGGLVELTSANVLRYVPPLNFNGADSFSYLVSDNAGGEARGVVAINVTNVNDVPVVLGEVVNTLEDTALQLTQLLDNDTDIDGDTLALASVTQSLQGGVVELMPGNVLRYIPAENFYGEDSFTYAVTDNAGGEASATVAVTVVPVNDVPVAKADFFSVTQNTQKVLDIMANDEGLGDQVQISLISAPSRGDLVLSNDQMVTYAPAMDDFGPDSFMYQLKDSDGEISVATVSVEVDCVNKCDQTFEISWVPSISSNVAGYKVYYGMDEANLDTVVMLGNVTSYDHLVSAKGVYHFAISAFNDDSLESVLTSTVSGMF